MKKLRIDYRVRERSEIPKLELLGGYGTDPSVGILSNHPKYRSFSYNRCAPSRSGTKMWDHDSYGVLASWQPDTTKKKHWVVAHFYPKGNYYEVRTSPKGKRTKEHDDVITTILALCIEPVIEELPEE